MSARPYKIFGERERALATSAAEERLRAWAPAWMPGEASLRIECVPAAGQKNRFAAEPAGWTRFSGAEDQWLAARVPEAGLRELAVVLCGGVDAPSAASFGGSSELAAAATMQALRDLAAALIGAAPDSLGVRRGALSAGEQEAWEAGSASLLVQVAVAQARIEFISSPAWTTRLLSQRLPRPAAVRLAERRASLASQRVELRVIAGAVELELRQLDALAVGNVIALDTRLDQPMAVVVACGGQAQVCAGRLGSIEGSKAVALGAQRS